MKLSAGFTGCLCMQVVIQNYIRLNCYNQQKTGKCGQRTGSRQQLSQVHNLAWMGDPGFNGRVCGLTV